jgi:DNA polymerase III alpha subunit
MSTQANNLTPQVSSNTKLKNRTLWFDGDTSYPSSNIHAAFGFDGPVFVDEMSKDVEKFNRLVSHEKQIRVKTENRPFDFKWTIPDEYKNIDVMDYLVSKLDQQNITDPKELKTRAVRVVKELKLYKQHELLDVLRVLIYVINTLNSNQVVWGVGRGSSVSSYVLYLIGVHDVDSVKYELDIEDFLH